VIGVTFIYVDPLCADDRATCDGLLGSGNLVVHSHAAEVVHLDATTFVYCSRIKRGPAYIISSIFDTMLSVERAQLSHQPFFSIAICGLCVDIMAVELVDPVHPVFRPLSARHS
jgi:hypothetical protein